MNFGFPIIEGLVEYRERADIIELIRVQLIRQFGELDSNRKEQHRLHVYLNDKKFQYPWLLWKMRMTNGKMNVVLFFDGLPKVWKRMEDVKVREGIL